MRILGIDPGSHAVGYGLIEASSGHYQCLTYGTLLIDASDYPNRLMQIRKGLNRLIKEYRPSLMAVEKLFFFKNKKTALEVAHARGVIMLCAAEHGLEALEPTPLQVKQAVSGYGRAQKTNIQKMVKLILKLTKEPTPDDAADALAVAICASTVSVLRDLRSK